MVQHLDHVLVWTAFTVALLHTLVGVDHYLPFVVLGRSRGWSFKKTMSITALCGVGHCAGSILLGTIGIGLGVALNSLELVEGIRGSVAAWGLIAFGLCYAAWAFIRQRRGKRHEHVHAHEDGTIHNHGHNHRGAHLHAHEAKRQLSMMTLFVLFVLGPCEALIPLVMAPAFTESWALVALVTLVFSAVTILTMLAATAVGLVGLSMVRLGPLERHANVLAGLAIAVSGLAIQLLGV